MGVPTLKRRERKNCKVYFIPNGEVVDSVTTSQTTWPDAAPTTNYTDFQFEDIEELIEEIISSAEQFRVPRDSGGYRLETEKHLEGMNYKGTTSKINSYLKTLQKATPNVVAAATAQAPNERAQLWMDGVFLVEIRNGAGAIIDRLQCWARMFLEDPGAGAKPETSKLQVMWEIHYSGNNTYLPVA